MNTTTQKTSKLNLNPLLRSVHTTHTSLTFNRDLTPIGMKTYMIKTNWSTKILTINLMNKLNVMVYSRTHMYQAHYDMP